jgi:hypothetical protein
LTLGYNDVKNNTNFNERFSSEPKPTFGLFNSFENQKTSSATLLSNNIPNNHQNHSSSSLFPINNPQPELFHNPLKHHPTSHLNNNDYKIFIN